MFNRFSLIGVTVVLLTLGTPSLPFSHANNGPVVPGFERLVQDKKHVPGVDGRFLAAELNCRSCHAGETAAAPKPAPILDAVASRAQAKWIQRFIADPHGAKPGTTMPSLLDADPATRADQAEAITHYLVSLSLEPPEHSFASLGDKLQGERDFFRVGCAACHQPNADKPLPTSVPLGDLKAKYTLPTLAKFLGNPLHVRKGGRMPSLNLTTMESRAISAWLLDTPEIAQIKYSYYEGNFNSLPDFGKLKPVATGEAKAIDVSPRKRDNQFALRFESGLTIDKAGDYKFHIGSDDGSALYIDGKRVAGPKGVHPFQVSSATVKLEPGGHSVVVEYFEQGGEERLEVQYEGPGISKRPLADALSSNEKPPQAPDLSFEVDAAKAAKGKKWFASLGCANCHHHHQDGGKVAKIASTLQAPAWSDLALENGCLAAEPNGKAPKYALNAVQRKALQAAARQQAPKALDAQIHQTMASFNCYTCHVRNEIGGVEAARNDVFQGTMKEMGDEARIPPKLDEAGAKLTDFWLDKTLNEGAKDRPYMLTRMPKFGIKNVGHLRPLMVKADELAPLPELSFPESVKKVKGYGRQMVGIRGFSCTQCHPFGRFPSKGIQSVDFTIMTQRLRKDWFRRYVRDPQAYRPRTRMPTAWPVGKPSPLKSILDGDADMQIAAVWEYLSDGRKARIPDGMITKSLELIPIETALIYRNFIEGGGPRAIGVGYPEQVHQAFDANNMRIALLWEGRFIDASRHWTGRGQGFQPPAGDKVLKLHDGAPFATLDGPSPKDSWPAESAKDVGYHFGGYRLSDEELRPTFLYRLNETKFEEYLEAAPEGTDAQVRRQFKVVNAKPNLFFRAAAGSIVQRDGWYVVDGKWQTKIIGAKPILRDGKELLVPVATGGSSFQQEIRW